MLSETIILGRAIHSYVTPTDTRWYHRQPWRVHTRARARDTYRVPQRCCCRGGVGCDGAHHRGAQGAVLEATLPHGAAETSVRTCADLRARGWRWPHVERPHAPRPSPPRPVGTATSSYYPTHLGLLLSRTHLKRERSPARKSMASSWASATDGVEDEVDLASSCAPRQRRARQRRLPKAAGRSRKGLGGEAGWGQAGLALAKPQSHAARGSRAAA